MKQKAVISVFAIVFACMFFTKTAAQQNVFTKYYDSTWKPVAKDGAFYYALFVKQDTFYQCTTFWARSNKLCSKSTYADTNFYKGIGKMISYYESGPVQDSIEFDNKGVIAQRYHFAENGVIAQHIFYDKPGDKWLGENYDAVGKKISGYFIYQEPAKFPGGASAWMDYLISHIKSKVPTKNHAPVGLYTVVVSFLVDKEGKIVEVKAENDPGFGTAEEAVRVIEKGPSWIPAQQNGKNVIYRQKQSITFQVSEK